MRIALLTDGVHPYVIGGMQKHSYYLARELAKNGHTVYLFHTNESKYDASKLEFFSDAERKNIQSFVIPFPHKKYFPLHYIYESKAYSEAIYKALSPLLPNTDFIFAQGFCAWSLLEHKKQQALPPVLVHFHGLEMFQKSPSLKSAIGAYFLRKAVRKNLSLADYTISFGGKITTILSSLIDKNKIWEIPGGIEKTSLTETIKSHSDKMRFVFVGRYERRKGISELTEAIQKLLADHDFSFDFIGDIPNENKLSHPSVTYHGKLSSEDEIKQVLSQCDVLMCPSYSEGMPNVIMEAMASGLALIATDVGAVSALVSSGNGWLIKSPSSRNISEAMAEAMQDKYLLQKKINSLEKIKTKFLLENVTKQLIVKIQDILTNKGQN